MSGGKPKRRVREEERRAFRVFISSTFIDNEDRRRIVEDAVIRAGMVPIGMERFTASAQPTKEECLRLVSECDLYVGIIARRYGWIPDDDAAGRSITEIEYDAAAEAEIPKLVFLLDDKVLADLAHDIDIGPDRWKKQEKLDAFKAKVQRDQMPARFTDTSLGAVVLDSLNQWKTGEGAGVAPRPEPVVADDFDAQLQRYLAKSRSRLETLPVAGFETKLRVPIRLAELHVKLRASVDLRGTEAHDDDLGTALASGSSEDNSLDEAFHCAQQFGGRRGVVILGDPGSGKTTQLKALFLEVAAGRGPVLGLPAELIPLFLPLRDISEGAKSFRDLVTASLADPLLDLPPEFARNLFRQDRLLILLDGLDEVSDDHRARVSEWISEALRNCPGSWFAVTCRFAGYTGDAKLPAEFLELHVRPFDRDRSETFIRRWFEIVETSLASDKEQARVRAAAESKELIETLRTERRSSRVAEMAGNPLLLTTICLVHRDRGRLPKRRADLYDECINILLERWREAKKLPVSVSARDARRVLQPAALWLHEIEGRTRASAEDLGPVIEPALAEIHASVKTAAEFLRSIRDESGLLTGFSADSFGFMHLGFQEYLAAREIRKREFEKPGALEELISYFGESWWQEVILLLLALEEPYVCDRFFRLLVDQPALARHGDLVQLCLEDAAQLTLEPFVELLGRASAANENDLWLRQLRALEIVESRAAERIAVLAPALRSHPFAEIRRRFVAESVVPAATVLEPADIAAVRIPAGTFIMGSQRSERDRHDDEGPQREVAISEFLMSRTPITNEQYGRFLSATKAKEPAYWMDRKFNQPTQPVVGVNWDEARACCRWLGGDLPTEAQWEYACRAGTTTRFWSGNADKDLARVGWFSANSKSRLHAVGEKPPNAFGLQDMHGSVREWCLDWFGPYPVPSRKPILDPQGPNNGAERVLRGGSWWSGAGWCRSAGRLGTGPMFRVEFVGFRVAFPAAAIK